MRWAWLLPLALAGCADLAEIGKTPQFTPISNGIEHQAMTVALAPTEIPDTTIGGASLWHHGRGSLLGDRRASQQGDILTVVIEISDSADISNSTQRGRSSNGSLGVGNFLGLENLPGKVLPNGFDPANAVNTNSSSRSSGDGSVSRSEELTLRVAATILEVLPNGVLRIRGSQEVRVNFEIRELLVDGYVRPEDISRRNEITYDKIASARISYGGRGQISRVQQPRYGQQAADIILPF
ncbi:MAG: flagellar basal body L-ring protein FlgH [Pseudomonadota bacterium]